MLDSGIDPVVMPCPQDLLQEPGFSIGPLQTGKFIFYNTSTGGQILGQAQTAHHFYVGIVFITSAH